MVVSAMAAGVVALAMMAVIVSRVATRFIGECSLSGLFSWPRKYVVVDNGLLKPPPGALSVRSADGNLAARILDETRHCFLVSPNRRYSFKLAALDQRSASPVGLVLKAR